MFKPEKHNFVRSPERIWLATPTMHMESRDYMLEAFDTNWMSTVGANINEVEKQVAQKIGCGHAVALSAGTAALHLCMKLAGEKIYGSTKTGQGRPGWAPCFLFRHDLCGNGKPRCL